MKGLDRVDEMALLALSDDERCQVLAYCIADIPDDVWRDALAMIARGRS